MADVQHRTAPCFPSVKSVPTQVTACPCLRAVSYSRAMRLVPCGSCRRHVSERDLACPFCGAARRSERSPARVIVGRYSRAAVFSGLSACWTSSSPATEQPNPPNEERPATAKLARPKQGLYGVLTDAKTGDPLTNVVLHAYALGVDAKASTNERGEFSVELTPGEYMIQFTGPDAPTWYVTTKSVLIEANQALRMDLPVDRTPMAMPAPYGAPPARRRTV